MISSYSQERLSLRSQEKGQALVFVLVGLGVFLLGSVALAVDFANLWFHRQTARNAADAACAAAAMDLLQLANGGTVTPAHLAPPANILCLNTNIGSPSTTNVACWYAAVNGYTSPGLTANAASNSVTGTHPDLSACPNGAGCPIPGYSPPFGPPLPGPWSNNPAIKITVVDRIKVYFLSLLGSGTTRDVGATAYCGLLTGTFPPPITVLAKTGDDTLTIGGNSHIIVYGGPPRSVQVNSTGTSAITGTGGAELDLSQGGPSNSGSSVGVAGGPATPCCDFLTYCPTACSWVSGSAASSDPFRGLTAPAIPTWSTSPTNYNGYLRNVVAGVDGCPDNRGCKEYFPGYYSGDITIPVGGAGSDIQTAIFVPGVYYMGGTLDIRNKSCVRPAIATTTEGAGDGSGGVMFYFANSNESITFNSQNSGDCTTGLGTGQVISSYAASTSRCVTSGVGASNLPANLAGVSFTGSVITGPCFGPDSTTGMCAPNCSLDYGDPLDTSDPAGVQRGLLFFGSRSATYTNPTKPSWTGGGNFFIVGNLYFHNSTSYNTEFTFQANTASGYFSGAIVVDLFWLGGTADLTMDLSPFNGFTALKATLLK